MMKKVKEGADLLTFVFSSWSLKKEEEEEDAHKSRAIVRPLVEAH